VGLLLRDADEPIAPTHWSFGQLSSLVGAPAAYLRQLPAPLAGINLQYGLTNHRAEQIKTMEVVNGRTELRAVTGPDYGRIYDHELVSAVQRIAGNGTGDTRWKVPGVLDWSTGISNHFNIQRQLISHPILRQMRARATAEWHPIVVAKMQDVLILMLCPS